VERVSWHFVEWVDGRMSKKKKEEAGKDGIESGYRELVESVKRASMAQVLFKSARLFNELALSRLRALTGHNIREVHTNLFPHIDLEGTRLTELAKRVGVSKQAVSQIVMELESMGTVERIPDPADGRAKLIRFSKEGRMGILGGLSLLKDMEEEFAEVIGTEKMRALHQGLLALLDALEDRMPFLEEE